MFQQFLPLLSPAAYSIQFCFSVEFSLRLFAEETLMSTYPGRPESRAIGVCAGAASQAEHPLLPHALSLALRRLSDLSSLIGREEGRMDESPNRGTSACLQSHRTMKEHTAALSPLVLFYGS